MAHVALAQVEALAEAPDNSLATKSDLVKIEKQINLVKAEAKLLKWMMGFVLAGIAALVIKTFFKR